MVSNLSRLDEVNVLASEANWAWAEALRDIFRPRGVNLLVAESAGEFINIIEQRRIHTTIVDMDSEKSNALAMIKIIRMDYPPAAVYPADKHSGRSNAQQGAAT